LAEHIKKKDIFITASKNDCCSNSLLEAMSCGLPAIAYNSGGNPEIVKDGGLLFDGKDDIIDKIGECATNLSFFEEKISVATTEETAKKYLDFLRNSKNV
jgi:glycosyltransferase involved in cell wall biosynthesis